MGSNYNVTDSSDWLETTLSDFAQLENSLRCRVCKDFFNTPVITSCAHTFCSLCIRRCLTTDGKCPVCRTGDQASKLRRNGAIEETVEAFKNARPEAFRLATAGKRSLEDLQSERAVKRRKVNKHEQATPPRSQRQTRSRAKQVETPQEVVDLDDELQEEEEEEEPEPDDGLVACPMCSSRMKEEAVFSHLDKCDGKPVEADKGKTSALPSQSSSKISSQPLERLPDINYSMMSDTALRKKLSQLGISSTGPKQLMIRRHTEWANLWNSNCDSARPKTKRELLHDLDMWERSQGGLARESHGSLNGIMKKDFDAKAYATSQSDDFARLIKEARTKSKPTRDANQVPEPATTDPGPPTLSLPVLNGAPVDKDSTAVDPESQERPGIGSSKNVQIVEGQTLSRRPSVAASPPRSANDALPVSPRNSTVGSSPTDHRRGSDSLPSRFAMANTRKVPMFSVSSSPVADVELTSGKS